MASVDEIAPVRPRESGSLRRDVGLIGLMWASVGSIIGSGWLYGAQKAVVVAGPAALISWCIGAVAIVLLALVHAELGGLFPVAGGTARYPHYAFGGLAGMSFGWFSWLQAATVAPIEVEAMIGYAGHWSWAQGFLHANGTLTTSGFIVAVFLMAIFVAVNFLGVKVLAHTNSAATWWKIAVPLGAIFVIAATNFHPHNFTSHGFAPFGAKGVLSAISTSGIIFALLGFEQAIQLAGESRNPKRDLPRATIGSVLIGAVIYILLQVVYIGALPVASFMHGWAKLNYAGISGPWAGLATVVGLGWLGWVLYADAIISPGGTGLIYTTSTSRISYGLSKNGYAPRLFEKTDGRGVPWFGLIISFVTGVICFLPFPSWQELVSFITSASVLMYAGAPLAFGVFRNRLPNHARPYRLPGGNVISPLSFIVASLIIYWAAGRPSSASAGRSSSGMCCSAATPGTRRRSSCRTPRAWTGRPPSGFRCTCSAWVWSPGWAASAARAPSRCGGTWRSSRCSPWGSTTGPAAPRCRRRRSSRTSRRSPSSTRAVTDPAS